MRVSKLQIYSIGVVAENKKLGSNMIEVTPLEDSPMLNGELNGATKQETIQSEDSQGAAYNVQLGSSNAVPAEWLPMGNGNRKTAPDVRRGAQVVLYYFADPKKLYWMTLMEDLHLRKLETVIWAFSATKNENDALGPDTYYYFEVSTHKGLVHFHSTAKNGEPFEYDIQINTKEGFIKFQDNGGNHITLDSKAKQITLKNADNCYFDLNKKNLTINVPETYTINAKNMVEKVQEALVTQATNVTTEASEAIQQQGGKVTVQGKSSVSISSPATSIV